MPLPKKRIYTVEDVEALPDGQYAELIDGEIVMLAAPSTEHQRTSTNLNFDITSYIRKHGGSCEVFAAPFAVYLHDEENGTESLLLPDLAVVCDKNKLDSKGCHGAPDLAVEITSPSTRRNDYGAKQRLYTAAGVREYWVIDLQRRVVAVWRSADDWAVQIFPFGQPVPVGIFPDLEISVD